MLCRDTLCPQQRLWPRKRGGERQKRGERRLGVIATVFHTPNVLLGVPLTWTGNSSVEVASGKMKSTSRCVATASVAYHQDPGPDPAGERGPPAKAPPGLRLGVRFRRGK